MYYTIYKITNLINGKYYIGKHQTKNLNDGYMGSGKLLKYAIAKYGIENFRKEILHIFETEAEMNAKEQELVVVCKESYNLNEGGKGGFSYINQSNIIKFKGKTHSDESKKKMGHPGNKYSLGKTPWNKGKTGILSDKHLEILSMIKSEEHKRKISESIQEQLTDPNILKQRQNIMMYARSKKSKITSDITRKKISAANKKSWTNRLRITRNWAAIQLDFDSGMSRIDLFEKYKLTRNILREAKKNGLFIGSYKLTFNNKLL